MLKKRIYELNVENKSLTDELNITHQTSNNNQKQKNNSIISTTLHNGYSNKIDNIYNIMNVYNDKITTNINHYNEIKTNNYNIYDVKQLIMYKIYIYIFKQ